MISYSIGHSMQRAPPAQLLVGSAAPRLATPTGPCKGDERLWLAGTGFAVALATAQWMPAAVAVPALLRAFSKNQSGSGDKAVLVSFIVLLCAHAAVVHVAR